MPEQPAGVLDLRENLILGQFANDVAAVRSLEFTGAIDAQRFVIAIATAGPLGKASLAEVAMLYGLISQMVERGLVKMVASRAGVVGSVKKGPRPFILLHESLVTRRDVAISRQAEAILGNAAKMIRERPDPRCREADLLTMLPSGGLSGAKPCDEPGGFGCGCITPTTKLISRFDLDP